MNQNNPTTHAIIISEDNAGQRIDNFLRIYLKDVPKSMIYRIVRKGAVRINKKMVTPKYKLQNNDEVHIPQLRRFNNKERTRISTGLDKVAALSSAVLYEDDHLLILNKPAGTAVHGGSGLSFGVIEGLRALRPDACFLELVHRLDRDTSGVLLIAKNRSALRTLHNQLRTQSIKKDYLALVRGRWQPHLRTVIMPLLKNIQISGERIVRVDSKGKPSETHFKIEEQFTLATLVRANPVTGRTHQIRVHAQHVGHPIAFDDRYGDGSFDRRLKDCGLRRLFLHAATLCFNHPRSGETLRINAPLDKPLCQCLLYLRKNYKRNRYEGYFE